MDGSSRREASSNQDMSDMNNYWSDNLFYKSDKEISKKKSKTRVNTDSPGACMASGDHLPYLEISNHPREAEELV